MTRQGIHRTLAALFLCGTVITGCGPEPIDMSWLLQDATQGACPDNYRIETLTHRPERNSPAALAQTLGAPAPAAEAAAVARMHRLNEETHQLEDFRFPIPAGTRVCIDLSEIEP